MRSCLESGKATALLSGYIRCSLQSTIDILPLQVELSPKGEDEAAASDESAPGQQTVLAVNMPHIFKSSRDQGQSS